MDVSAGAACVGVLWWQQIFVLPARIVGLGQSIGMAGQIAAAVGFIVESIPMKLEYSMFPMFLGQFIVVIGLLLPEKKN